MSAISSVVGIDESDPRSKVDLTVWLFFQIAAGNVGLPLLVTTFVFAKSVNRHPTLVNMCITWIISGISSSLLFYAGKQSGPEPSHSLCIAQASLLYGVPPMCSMAAFALVFTVWSSFNAPVQVDARRGKFGLLALLIAPYITLGVFMTVTAVMASQHVELVNRHRRFFYCSFKYSPLSNAMAVFSAVVCFISLLLEIYILVCLSRNWRGLSSPNISSDARRGLDKQLIGRLFIFSGFLVVALVFSAVSVLSPQTVVPDMFAASIGVAVFVVFGTQTDVLRVWAFWLPKASPEISQDSSCYVPRELKFPESSLDSSFDIGSEKSTLAPFENIGQRVSVGCRDQMMPTLANLLNEETRSARGSRRSSRAPALPEEAPSRVTSIAPRSEEAINSLQKTFQRV